MIKTIITAGVTALVVALLVVALVGEKQSVSLGADGDSNFTNLVTSGDVTVGDDLIVTDDATISGGTLTVTTAASATSTLTIGKIQTYATSSATQICIVFSNLGATSTFAGTTYWSYGTCN